MYANRQESQSDTQPAAAVWREWEFWTLALLMLGIYASRISDLSLRGEETRWAGCAREILASGDWIVPRQQGLIHADRPPLANWLIAVSAMAIGNTGPVAVRMPSVLAAVLTTLLIYWYSRSFLTRVGALAAGAAFGTMAEVLALCRLAETDSLLTLLVSASLLVWHAGYSRFSGRLTATRRGARRARCSVDQVDALACGSRLNDATPEQIAVTNGSRLMLWTWISGYSFAALAALAKGPQGPVYFVAAVVVFLAWRRDWRTLCSWPHLAGIAVFVALIGVWQVPYYHAAGWDAVRTTWGEQAGKRFDYSQPAELLKHLTLYPLQVLGCMLPWSLFLWAYADRRFRATIGPARSHVAFLITAIVVAFPSVWLATMARTRYFLPLYPCFAPLVGLVVDRCCQANLACFWQRSWRRFLWMFALAIPVASLGVLVASFAGSLTLTVAAQPPQFAIGYALAGLLLAAICCWSLALRPGVDDWRARAGLLAIAGFIGLTYSGVAVNAAIRSSEDVAANVARLKLQLPPDAHLVSLNKTHHRFAYHYGDAIRPVVWPDGRNPLPEDVTYFCFEQPGPREIQLPFAWEKLAVISVERNRQADPWDKVVVGRRLEVHSATATADRRN